MTDTTVDPKIEKALRRLVPGVTGIDQPHTVRGKTLTMEKAGLIEHRDGGWHLTDAGAAIVAK